MGKGKVLSEEIPLLEPEPSPSITLRQDMPGKLPDILLQGIFVCSLMLRPLGAGCTASHLPA